MNERWWMGMTVDGAAVHSRLDHDPHHPHSTLDESLWMRLTALSLPASLSKPWASSQDLYVGVLAGKRKVGCLVIRLVES